jgi:hypothetical protein
MPNKDSLWAVYNKGGKHGARTSVAVHGAPNQGSNSATIVKCQNNQISGRGNRDQGDPFSPDVSTQVPVCQHVRGSLHPMVGVQEDSSSQAKLFDDF